MWKKPCGSTHFLYVEPNHIGSLPSCERVGSIGPRLRLMLAECSCRWKMATLRLPDSANIRRGCVHPLCCIMQSVAPSGCRLQADHLAQWPIGRRRKRSASEFNAAALHLGAHQKAERESLR